MDTPNPGKLPPGTVIRSEDYGKWYAPLPSDPVWAILQRALPKHPLLVIRAARMLSKQHKVGMHSEEGQAVLFALFPAINAANIAVPPTLAGRGPEDAVWLRTAVAHIREHGVRWPEANP